MYFEPISNIFLNKKWKIFTESNITNHNFRSIMQRLTWRKLFPFHSHLNHITSKTVWNGSPPISQYSWIFPMFVQIQICINEISLQTKFRRRKRRWKFEIKKCTLHPPSRWDLCSITLKLECFKYSCIFAEFSIEACSANLTLYWSSSSSTRSYTAFASRSQYFH